MIREREEAKWAEGVLGPPLIPLEFVNNSQITEIPIGPVNVRSALARGYPQVGISRATTRKCVIVGGGRSILGQIDKLRELYDEGAYFLAVNQVHNWLIENAMKPHGQIIYEVGPIMDHLQLHLHPDVRYFVCSICDPETFDKLEGYDIHVWNTCTQSAETNAAPAGHFLVGGGGTTMARAIPLGLHLGFRNFDVFGAESSYEELSHFNGTPEHAKDRIDITVKLSDGRVRVFNSAPYLALQAQNMRDIFKLHHWMFKCRFHGDGMLPWIHRNMFPEQYADQAA